MMLTNKVAVIYGAAGAIGGAVARAFAAEGADLFLTGRTLAPVEDLARDVGGSAEAAEVDALDEQAVDGHLQSVVDRAGRVDVSVNAVGIPNATIRSGTGCGSTRPCSTSSCPSCCSAGGRTSS